MTKEELEKATGQELIEQRDYCGVDGYYGNYLEDVNAEMLKRFNRLEELEKEVNMLRQGYVWQDYDPGEGSYEDTHEGKWVKRWEPWRYIKDELPKIEIGYKVAVEVCYLNVYDNPCKMECDWNGKDFIYQYFNGKTWNFDKKVSLLGKVFAWRYKVDDWPTPPKEKPKG